MFSSIQNVKFINALERWSTMFNAADCVIFSWENFWKVRELLNFWNVNHSTEHSGNSGRKIDWNGNSRQEILKNLAIPDKVVLFYGNSGKYCSRVATGNFQKVILEFFVELKAPRIRWRLRVIITDSALWNQKLAVPKISKFQDYLIKRFVRTINSNQ